MSFKISEWKSFLLPFSSFAKSITGMLQGEEDCVGVASAGLSAISRTNLSGMDVGLAFLSS